MGLFTNNKKLCPICGNPTPRLLASAVEGQNLCKECAAKIDLPDGDYIIRKLTPIEAERLQTLPDNYTTGISNTQRYKCIGNGWTVDVIAHILGGLKNVEGV